MWERVKRWRWAIGIGALVAIALGYSFWPEAVPVDTAEVTRGPMAVGITDDGVTRIHDLFVVSAPVTGRITRIEIEPGDAVVANETVVARMAARPATPLDARTRRELSNALAAAGAAQRSAAAQVQRARAGVALARRELERAETLADRGFLAQAALDSRRADAEAQSAALAAARASVEQARAEADRIRALLSQPAPDDAQGGPVVVRSPASGVVLRRLTESEGVIAEGTPLVEIGDPAQVEVVTDLLSREAVRVEPGARVEITGWGGARPLIGRVRTIEPFGRLKISALGIEEQRVNVVIDFADDAAALARLGHGYQIDATIILWRREDAVRLPIGALFRGADGAWHVYAIEGGRAVERVIDVGRINDDHAEILDGIEPGASVIINPGNQVRDGRRVRPRN